MRRAIPSSSPVSHPVQPEESTRPFLSLPAALWRTAVRPQMETVRFASRPVCRKPAAPRVQTKGFPPFPSLHPALPSVCELSEPFSRPASHKHPPSAIRQNLFLPRLTPRSTCGRFIPFFLLPSTCAETGALTVCPLLGNRQARRRAALSMETNVGVRCCANRINRPLHPCRCVMHPPTGSCAP